MQDQTKPSTSIKMLLFSPFLLSPALPLLEEVEMWERFRMGRWEDFRNLL